MTRIGGPGGPNIPAVVIPVDEAATMLTVGIPDMTFDGRPFPFETVDDWTIRFGRDSMATLTVTIPILLVAAGEVDPDDEP